MASERARPAASAALLAALASLPAEAAWINAAWQFRQTASIANSAAAASNIPVLIQFDSVARVAAGQMRSDCADLRVTAADQVSSLAHWIKAGCNSASTQVWVRLDSLPAGTTQVYLYFGNPAASTLSDADAVFGFDASEPAAAYDYHKHISSSSLIEGRTSSVDLANGDDVCGGVQSLGFDARFYGASVTTFTVNSNGAAFFSPVGCLTRVSPLASYWTTQRFAASFWADQRTDVGGGVVTDPGVYFDALSGKARITWMTTRFSASADSLIHQVLLFSSGKAVLSMGDGTGLANFTGEGIGIADGTGRFLDVTAEQALNRSWVFYLRKTVSPEPGVFLGAIERIELVDYRSRDRISVSNDTGQTLSSFQVALSFDTRALIPARMRSDCADIRVTDSDGITILSHWLESGCDSAATRVWVNVPSLAAGGRTLHLFYGNSSASTLSDADAVFGFDASAPAAAYDYYKHLSPASLIESRTSSVDLANGDDVCSGVQSLGFDARFYGASVTTFTVNSNGAAFFSPTSCLTNTAPPSTFWATRRFAASFWADQRTDTAGGVVTDPGVYFDALSNKARITWMTTRYLAPADSLIHQVLLFSSGKVVLSMGDGTGLANFNAEGVGITDGTGRFLDVTAEQALNRSWVFYLRKTASPEPRAKLRARDLSMVLPL